MSQQDCGAIDMPSKGKSNKSSNMDVLLRMGFAKDRAEKALSCTGDVSVPAAIDWILSHKDDPLLDTHDEREYLIYLCPSGSLLERLHEFLRKTAWISGRNGAHLHMPHITMCHAFKTAASNVPAILAIMEKTSAAVLARLPAHMKLERYSSENFMGLFLDKNSESVLKEYSQTLVTALQSLTGKPIPFNSEKAFHLTLAYHFDTSQYETIHGLSKRIALGTPCQWQFLLLSRDARFHSHEVYQMVHPWGASSHDDELPYNQDDYLYVASKRPSVDERNGHKAGSWVSAVSWSTGCSGMVPLTGISKTFASDVWILHGSIAYGTSKIQNVGDGQDKLIEDIYPPAQRRRWVQMGMRHKEPHPAEVSSKKLDKYGVGEDSVWRRRFSGTESRAKETNGSSPNGCTAFVMRHGERMDFVFGVDWIHKCFDEEGNFSRVDLNMPALVPKRRAGPTAYIRDPPLTAMGTFQAQITGKAMKDAGVTFSRVYVSPALRSIQTATAVLEAYVQDGDKQPKLCVEPGLYEWLGWVREAHPDWLTHAELLAFGISVDLDYKPYFLAHQLDFNEDVEGFYARNGHIVQEVMAKHANEGGNYLFVAHASSLDTCTRQLTGSTPRNHFDMNRVTQRVPYCAVVTCSQGPDLMWSLKNPPFPTLTHGHNMKFNAIQTLVTPMSSEDTPVGVQPKGLLSSVKGFAGSLKKANPPAKS